MTGGVTVHWPWRRGATSRRVVAPLVTAGRVTGVTVMGAPGVTVRGDGDAFPQVTVVTAGAVVVRVASLIAVTRPFRRDPLQG
ncbi:hypothetical protein JCM9534A_82790 [Catenuloplanes indicus JCM 9534]